MAKIKNPRYATFMNEVENYISILSKDDLIKSIDSEFKRFSAFRKPLKALTASSKLLLSVK